MRNKLAIASMLAAAIPAAAHHGWSGYDDAKPLTVTGKVIESRYEQPHGSLRLRAADRTWLVILAPPSRMETRGLAPADIDKGRTVTVVGYAHREKREELRAERITAGGKTVELR